MVRRLGGAPQTSRQVARRRAHALAAGRGRAYRWKPCARLREPCDHARPEELGEEAFGRAFDEGAFFTVDQAVAYALSGKAPARGKAAAGKLAGDLTRREFEVAGLVADGLSNKEIAARLVISHRTAEAHVEHILAKLGFTSRAQIASWFAQREAATNRLPTGVAASR